MCFIPNENIPEISEMVGYKLVGKRFGRTVNFFTITSDKYASVVYDSGEIEFGKSGNLSNRGPGFSFFDNLEDALIIKSATSALYGAIVKIRAFRVTVGWHSMSKCLINPDKVVTIDDDGCYLIDGLVCQEFDIIEELGEGEDNCEKV